MDDSGTQILIGPKWDLGEQRPAAPPGSGLDSHPADGVSTRNAVLSVGWGVPCCTAVPTRTPLKITSLPLTQMQPSPASSPRPQTLRLFPPQGVPDPQSQPPRILSPNPRKTFRLFPCLSPGT